MTPFINPDGLVVMDINQEIDDVNGSTPIEGVGNVPNTDKRSLSSEIAVKNGDTVMLGGFIKNQKSTSKSGVPFLMDIPLLGNLFSSRSDSKQREELIVLMRPTVLRTPELAAAQAVKEQQRLPGVSAAAAEEVRTEHKLVEAEKKAELKNAEEDQRAEQKRAEAERIHAEPWRWKRFGSVDTNTAAQAMTEEEVQQRKAEQAEKKRQHSQPQSQSKFFQPVLPDGTVDTNTAASPNP